MFETILFHSAVGGGALWLISVSLFMETKNFISTLIFKFLPLMFGLGLAAVWLIHMRMV